MPNLVSRTGFERVILVYLQRDHRGNTIGHYSDLFRNVLLSTERVPGSDTLDALGVCHGLCIWDPPATCERPSTPRHAQYFVGFQTSVP